MNKVKVTVLMPAFNAAGYIAEAIQSILGQTFTDFELLIINDGSTDSTLSIIRQFTDPRITILDQPNQGICETLNRGLSYATGEYIARFDADDICFPQRLQKQVDFLNANPSHILTGCDAEYIDEKGQHLFSFQCKGHSHEEIMKNLLDYCPFIHSGVMYRRQPVIDAGGYNPDAHGFEDYLLWVQLAGNGYYNNIPEQLIKVRFNSNSVTIDEKWRGRRFVQLKKNIIRRKSITAEEGRELLSIIRTQDTLRIKKGAYNALCGKKFLLNNYRPSRARSHFAKAIGHRPFRIDNYMMYLLSFFPPPFIHWLHRSRINSGK